MSFIDTLLGTDGTLDPSTFFDSSQSLADPNTSLGGLFDASGGLGGLLNLGQDFGATQMFLDNQTGQLLTLDQVQAIDPSFSWNMAQAPFSANTGSAAPSLTGGSDVLRSGGSAATGPYDIANQASPTNSINSAGSTDWTALLKNLPGLLAATGGLAATGAGIGALFGLGNQPNPSTVNTVTQPSLNTETVGPSSTNVQTAPVQNSIQTLPTSMSVIAPPTWSNTVSQPSSSTTTNLPTSTTSATRSTALDNPQTAALLSALQGPATGAAGNLPGLLQGQIGAIPQLNPTIMAAINQNALGLSQGDVPTLASPQAQAYFQNVLGGQNAAVDYNTGNALSDAIAQLNARGFAGGADIFREGAPAAAMGPILAQANAQKAMNLGNINAQQLAYALQLPQIGSQLATQALNQQQVPFNAYTQALSSQSGIPQALLNALMQAGGSTTQTNTSGGGSTTNTTGQNVMNTTSGGTTLTNQSGGGSISNLGGQNVLTNQSGNTINQSLGGKNALQTTTGAAFRR